MNLYKVDGKELPNAGETVLYVVTETLAEVEAMVLVVHKGFKINRTELVSERVICHTGAWRDGR